MANIIQTNVSDKDYEDINEFIRAKTLQDYNGNYLVKRSTVAAYLINLGIRVIKSKSEKETFNLIEYRKELLKRVLQSVQLSKAVINILNELPEFEKRKSLFNEFYNENSESIDFIKKIMDDIGFSNDET